MLAIWFLTAALYRGVEVDGFVPRTGGHAALSQQRSARRGAAIAVSRGPSSAASNDSIDLEFRFNFESGQDGAG